MSTWRTVHGAIVAALMGWACHPPPSPPSPPIEPPRRIPPVVDQSHRGNDANEVPTKARPVVRPPAERSRPTSGTNPGVTGCAPIE